MEDEQDWARARQELLAAEQRLQDIKDALSLDQPPLLGDALRPAASLQEIETRKTQMQETLQTSLSQEAAHLAALIKEAEATAPAKALEQHLLKVRTEAEAKIASLQNQVQKAQAAAAAQIEDLQRRRQEAQAAATARSEDLQGQLQAKQSAATAQIEDLQLRLQQTQSAAAAQIENLQLRLQQTQAAAAAQIENLQLRLQQTQAAATKSQELAPQAADLEARLREAEKRNRAEAAKSRELEVRAATLEMQLREARAAHPDAETAAGKGPPPLEGDGQGPVAPEGRPFSSPERGGPSPLPEGTLPPMPALEPVLDTGWSKVLEFLSRSLTAAYAHLRKLSATPMADDQRARLRLAAGSLAQGTDAVTSLGEFLDEAGAAPAPGRLENAVAAALAGWEPALRQRGISVSRNLAGDPPPALFHPEGLRLVLYQVLRNAYESMPQGGSLMVRLWKDAPTGMVCVSFSDTGAGFSREALARLPAPFATTKPGHLGLGLALTRRILGRWGGSLDAANNEKIGGIATLRFATGKGEPPPLQADPIK